MKNRIITVVVFVLLLALSKICYSNNYKLKRIMNGYKEAAIALFTFKAYTRFSRAKEVCLGVLAWVNLIGLIFSIYNLLPTLF